MERIFTVMLLSHFNNNNKSFDGASAVQSTLHKENCNICSSTTWALRSPATLIFDLMMTQKKWDPGILDPSRFSGQIRKVEARLGKLAKIRKNETD